MHPLDLIAGSERFPADPSAPTRAALLHRSFRVIDRERHRGRKTFASHFPPLGLLNLARSLRHEAGRGGPPAPEMRLFDEEDFDNPAEQQRVIREWLEPASRRLVLATTYTNTIRELDDFLGGFDPTRTLIVAGGAHVTVSPDLENAHVLVRGEGGAGLRHLLRRLGTPEFGSGPEATGLCYVAAGRKVMGRPAFDRSLEVLPSPAFDYDLLTGGRGPGPAYATNITRMLGGRPQIYVCTQSCRARCSFCSTYLIHGKSKSRPVALIRQDLAHLVDDLGHDTIEFHDDDLLQHGEFDELLDLLRSVGVPWFCFARTETIDEAMAEALARAGCRRVFLGVESMSQDALDYFTKGTTVEQNRRAVEALAAAGIGAVAGFIVGAPHDTVESILETQDAYLSLPLSGLSCSILSPDPGTREFFRAQRRGGEILSVIGGAHNRELRPDVARFGGDEPAGLPTVCESVSKHELNLLVALIEAEFYFRPQVAGWLYAVEHAWQRDRVEDFYAFLAARLRELDFTACDPAVAERRARVLDEAAGARALTAASAGR